MRATILVSLFLFGAMAPFAPVAASSCSGSSPANDCIASALEWFAKPQTFSNVGATMEAGEPTTCDGETVHHSAWYTLEVLAPGSPDAFMVDLEAPFWSTLGFYERTPGGAFVEVACAAAWEDEGMQQPTVFAPCTAGKTYWIQIGGQSASDSGSFDIIESRYWKFDQTMSQTCPFKPTIPTEPRMYAPTGGNGEISVSWVEPWWDGGSSVSLSHYKIYGADSCSGTFSLLGSTTARFFSEYDLPAATSRCYKVTAVNAVGEGPSEPGRSATTWSPPRAPASLGVARGGDGELVISWPASPDQPGPAPMVSYYVYSAPTASGPYTLTGHVGSSARSFSHTGLADGTTVHYRVTAVNVVGEGALGPAASGTTWQVPGAPSDVSVSHRIGLSPLEFQVSWDAPTEAAPFTHYRIYRASSPEAAPQSIGEVTSSQTSFVDRNRGPFIDYYYEVRAANPAGLGAASDRACIVYPIESPLARCE